MNDVSSQNKFVPLLFSSTGGQRSDDVVSIGFRHVETILHNSAIICMPIVKVSKEI